MIEQGPGRCGTALSHDTLQCGLESSQRRPAHPVDGQLVLPLDAMLSIPGLLRRLEHCTLDYRRLEAACRRGGNSVLANDATQPSLRLTGLSYSPPAVLCEVEGCIELDTLPPRGLPVKPYSVGRPTRISCLESAGVAGACDDTPGEPLLDTSSYWYLLLHRSCGNRHGSRIRPETGWCDMVRALRQIYDIFRTSGAIATILKIKDQYSTS